MNLEEKFREIMKTAKILVISQNTQLVEATCKAVEDAISVDYAASESEGLNILRQTYPDIIILGELDPPGSVSKVYRDLREGWISHHASIFVVEIDRYKNTHRILSDENLRMELGAYAFREGVDCPPLPIDTLVPLLKAAITESLESRENHFKNAMLDPKDFCLVWEQIPGPGAFEMRQEMVLENARKAAASRKACAISITDNPGGNPAIATDILCAEIRKSGIEPLVHIAMRDRSRNQAESMLFQLAALAIHNVLLLSGDYPSDLGFTGKSKPVFDLDSVNGLRLAAEMNQGMEREILRKPVRLAPTDFFCGVAFSPFKQMEAEVMGQYYKMQKKVRAGADFAITQVGYDARKLQEFMLWMKTQPRQIPALAGIYVLSYPVAKTMHENNIPGCVVTETLLQRIAEESKSADKGRQAKLERAAKMYAIVKGMGYKGAYISGQGLPFESVEYIAAKGNELEKNWPDLVPEFDLPQTRGFYLYERDAQSGLNAETPSLKTQHVPSPAIYRISKIFHDVVFKPEGALFQPARTIMQRVDSSPQMSNILHFFERAAKGALYACRDCGDCALFEAAYLCPMSQCPKDQRNAPCGGSYEGWCEVYPGKKQCIWVRAYVRLKNEGREQEIGEKIIPPCNWALWQTSAWINYFLGRDHRAQMKSE
jgi:methylenetetrahydrofolate reductase (NADPH)